jgi:hypothetical protein
MRLDAEKAKAWAASLSDAQKQSLLVELLDYAVDAEMVSMGDHAPYWSASGDPLIEGQEPFDS